MASSEALAWVRTDGQSGRANPALVDQFAADRAACGVTATSDNFALRAAEACMSGRGYVLVPASQAEATAARFRANAAAQYPAGGGAIGDDRRQSAATDPRLQSLHLSNSC